MSTTTSNANGKPPPATGTGPPSRFRPATREKIRLRMAIDGPSGAGKTVTALRLASALGKRIAVIDTESGSARKYIGEDYGDGPIAFDVLELTTFPPTEYTSAIEEAGKLGYDVLIVDSLSHAWEGKEGALELKDKAGGNKFTAWKDVTPMHRRMVEAILTSPCHVICTMRSKTEYVLEKNEQGKEVPRKVGTAPIQRWGMEYEFDIYGSMDWSHLLTVTKSRCRAVDGAVAPKPGPTWMAAVIEWLEKGTPAAVTAVKPTIRDDQLARVTTLLRHLCWPLDRVTKEFPRKYGCMELHELYQAQADTLIKWLEAQLASRQRTAEPKASTTPAAPAEPPASPITPTASPAQLQQLKAHRDELFARLGVIGNEAVTAAWQKILGNYGVTTARDLTPEQAAKLAGNLAHKLNTLDIASPPGDAAAAAEREAMRTAAAGTAPSERKEDVPQPAGTKSAGA